MGLMVYNCIDIILGVFSNMKKIKSIGLVAHDARKNDMVEWVEFNAKRLGKHKLICTGTTGKLVERVYMKQYPDIEIEVVKLKSGPLGGDQQVGAMIANGELDILIFFIDPMTTQPHDVDIKALERMCSVYNVVIACTRSTADFVISSHLFEEDYEPVLADYVGYLNRKV